MYHVLISRHLCYFLTQKYEYYVKMSFDFDSKGDPELVSAIYGRGIAYGKKSLQVSDF